MSAHVVFKGIDAIVKERIKSYWQKKLPSLQKLLAPYPEELREIRMTVSRHSKDSEPARYEAKAVVSLPTGTLAAHADDSDPQVAIDRIADDLRREIRRNRELARRDYIYKRKNRDRANLGAAGPQLQRHREGDRRQDFFRAIRAYLDSFRDFARREIRALERDRTLHPGEITEDDLIDAVLVRAWEEFDNRPRQLSLDQWLTNLLLDTLEQWTKQEPRPHVSLEADANQVAPETVPHDDEPDWWDELIGDEERLTLGDLIPESEGTDVWQELEDEERQNRLLSLLGELPRRQRQTFALYALEGYATDEIAMMQDRPEADVKADIEAARKTLGARLLSAGLAREKAEMVPAVQA